MFFLPRYLLFCVEFVNTVPCIQAGTFLPKIMKFQSVKKKPPRSFRIEQVKSLFSVIIIFELRLADMTRHILYFHSRIFNILF